jgi:hypothetical protein
MTNNQIVEAFADGAIRGTANSMFIDKAGNSTVIYSYGSHFPIAMRTSDLFAYVNSDKYSVTTTKHQNKVKKALGTMETEYKTTDELKEIIRKAIVA